MRKILTTTLQQPPARIGRLTLLSPPGPRQPPINHLLLPPPSPLIPRRLVPPRTLGVSSR